MIYLRIDQIMLGNMMGNEELKPASTLNKDIPKHVDLALTRALSISQEQRFPDVASFRLALKGQAAAQTILAGPAVPERRRPSMLWFGIGFLPEIWGLVAVLGFMLTWVWMIAHGVQMLRGA